MQQKQTIIRDPRNPNTHLLVSTVHTSDHGPETMVFAAVINWRDLYAQTYPTMQQAIRAHDDVIADIHDGSITLDDGA